MRPGYITGTSEDGRYAVIQLSTTNQKLTDDTPTLPTGPRYIYRYDSVTDELEPVGAASNAQIAAGGSGVRWVGPDAKTVLYQSTAVHAPGALSGQPNLYVWREGEGVKLVASIEVGRSSGWRAASRDGRYFVFPSYSEALAQRFGYDNLSLACSTTASPGPCQLVYRYDVEEDRLECVSCRPDGDPPDGHHSPDGVSGVSALRMDYRLPQYVADDGTVFFDSRDPLVASDLNGEYDTYAWRDGELRLVSRAVPGLKSRFIDATPDGRTVFIATADRIVPSDTDRSYDIYAARLDGGFVEQSDGLPDPCAGSDCRPPVTAPSLPGIGSIGFGGGGNVPPAPVGASVGVSRLKAVAGAAAKLKVRVPGAGRISVAGARIRRTGRPASKAGTYSVRIALSPRARKSLKRKTKLKVRVRVSYRAKDGQSASKTVKVTFRQPKSKRAKVKKGGR
jgi:hypothetical protein